METKDAWKAEVSAHLLPHHPISFRFDVTTCQVVL